MATPEPTAAEIIAGLPEPLKYLIWDLWAYGVRHGAEYKAAILALARENARLRDELERSKSLSGPTYCHCCGTPDVFADNLCAECCMEAQGLCAACEDPVELCSCDPGPDDAHDPSVWPR